ncbi:uncharacterized protein ACA1_249310 [Acanthamoeba castellanii str. Neff]|uniref:Glycosyltransferase family 92 protein n=1 Tax=Acanthamoeba castellanii (strain ATCC 30010 / Neff) TaxID=1257118 RepID=L8GX73_ACACF|nr:uncharacterized protein ACA1_249310 [Acanthamoeba castellanii str. Neff]ELR17874.1 hypothetical protein ACA1_249310 [Acanthamoeba castellanii str. Neff]
MDQGDSQLGKRSEPPRFPDVPEASIPTVWDDTVPLIYTTAPGVKPGHVWLFGQGVLVNESDPQPLQCVLGGVARPMVRSKRFWYTKFTTAFLCELPSPPGLVEGGALLTILHRGAPAPSTARYRPELFVDSVKSDNADSVDVVGPLRYGTCMVTQMRDMAYMVDEWVAYHRHIGIDHFYIYDNNSTDHLAALYGHGHDDIEVIPWPWRRPTRTRWPSPVQGTVAHVLDRYKCSVSSVVELRFEGLRPSHDNLTTCPDTPVIETYIHRRPDKNAYDLGFGLVMSSAADALHHIHFAELQSHRKSVKVAHDVAFGYHFSDRCWPQYYRQKCFGRGSIRDWDIPNDVDETHPKKEWWDIGKHAVVTDTRLRDFKRTLVGPAPAPVIRRAPFDYTCG